ncbi:hypothetical protein RN001_003371 [Aquatica leii]|uniref:Odorant receptor n=1 Tax=Aquatica leii TaxID=1421715 RepID=A0AAN7ST06_9COLE|nr:hypothetical protein RN001_003371 [Aquatica leii]
MFTDTKNENENVENFTAGVSLLFGSLKAIVGYYIHRDLGIYLRTLSEKQFCSNAKRYGVIETILMNKCLKHINTQTITLCVIPFFYILFANIPCIYKRITQDSGWTFPFGSFPLFDTTYSPNYEFALLYVNIVNFGVFIIFMALVATIVGVMVFLNYQCQILQNRIKKCSHHSFENNVFNRLYLENNLKDCARQLTSIMEISRKFKNLFSFLLLVDFIGLSVIIALCLLVGITIKLYDLKSAQLFTMLFAAIYTEFLTTYWGSELVKEYLAIGDCYYDIDFVGIDIRLQRSLRFMIQQTQKPIQFSVGGFSPLTMRTFLLVLKGSYSGFTLLYNLNKVK